MRSEMERSTEWICPECTTRAPWRLRGTSHRRPTRGLCEMHGSARCRLPIGETHHPPEKPLVEGAMHSPGFFPNGYLGKPFNGGYYLLQALGNHTDSMRTKPHGMRCRRRLNMLSVRLGYHPDGALPEPQGQTRTYQSKFPGFYGFIRDWDVGGTYTDNTPCPACRGAGCVRISGDKAGGFNIYELCR